MAMFETTHPGMVASASATSPLLSSSWRQPLAGPEIAPKVPAFSLGKKKQVGLF